MNVFMMNQVALKAPLPKPVERAAGDDANAGDGGFAKTLDKAVTNEGTKADVKNPQSDQDDKQAGDLKPEQTDPQNNEQDPKEEAADSIDQGLAAAMLPIFAPIADNAQILGDSGALAQAMLTQDVAAPDTLSNAAIDQALLLGENGTSKQAPVPADALKPTPHAKGANSDLASAKALTAADSAPVVAATVKTAQKPVTVDGESTKLNLMTERVETLPIDSGKKMGQGEGQAKNDGDKNAQVALNAHNMAETTFNNEVTFDEAVRPAQTAPQIKARALDLIGQIKAQVSQEHSEIQVKLRPSALGDVTISLATGEKGMIAKLYTNKKETEGLLRTEMAILQDSLREKGLQVAEVEVIYQQTSSLGDGEFSRRGGQFAGRNGTSRHGTRDDVKAEAAYYSALSDYDRLQEQGSSLEFNA